MSESIVTDIKAKKQISNSAVELAVLVCTDSIGENARTTTGQPITQAAR